MGGGDRRLYRHLPRGRHIARLSGSAAADERGNTGPDDAGRLERGTHAARSARQAPGGAEVAEVCTGCHGQRGIASDPQNPNLAGQSAIAIYKQLHDYKSGSRANEIMAGIAQGLNDQQIIDAATHFASGTRRSLDPTTAEVIDQDIVRLVERGDPARSLPACNSCHGFNAGGPLETPTLSHQNREYLARQLHAFKSGARRNDIYTRMRSVAAKLTDREIDKLAQFYATTLSY